MAKFHAKNLSCNLCIIKKKLFVNVIFFFFIFKRKRKRKKIIKFYLFMRKYISNTRSIQLTKKKLAIRVISSAT